MQGLMDAIATCAPSAIAFPHPPKMRSPEQQLQQQIDTSLSLESVQNQLTVVIPKSR
ncbi:hypothetical protein H6F74_03930 [Trichocoleus sp. FACHB-90]|uniref:hypothetical protein n=1 Tax=Cyanophyceae TaxID=3028117 RepID=UPI00168224D0|nr:hypothetical protein [Trichocoleus sp. FACHB-90]MBD1925438.1 hypothetical protein [Trichocoleus sp. FACHB-90]